MEDDPLAPAPSLPPLRTNTPATTQRKMPLRPRPPAGARAGSRAKPQQTRAEQPPLRAFSRLTSPWIGGTRCQKKRRVALRECEEGPKPAAAAGRQQSKLGPPPAASVPPDPLDVVGSSFQVRPTAVRLLPCTSTRSGCLFPCHLASPGSGERGLLPAFLPSGENRADQSRESGWAGTRSA